MKGGIGETTSKVIAISRVLCILCVIYAHAPPYHTPLPLRVPSYDAAIWTLREVLGRSSVPLLSIISGYLAARLAMGGGWRRTLRRKAATLLLPLLLWNAIALSKDIAFSLGEAMPAFESLPRLLLAIGGEPRLTPLYFLRDIFLCSLFAPWLLAGLRHARWVLMTCLAANAAWNMDGPLFISGAIPLFYALGLGLGQGYWSAAILEQRPRLCWAVAAGTLAALAVLPLVAAQYPALRLPESLSAALLIVRRFAAAAAFWVTAAAIARHHRLARAFAGFEPVIFFIFCAHPLIIGLAWTFVGPAARQLGKGSEFAAFAAAPFMVLALGYLAVWMLRRVAPRLLGALMAGKVPSDRQMMDAVRPLALLANRPTIPDRAVRTAPEVPPQGSDRPR